MMVLCPYTCLIYFIIFERILHSPIMVGDFGYEFVSLLGSVNFTTLLFGTFILKVCTFC